MVYLLSVNALTSYVSAYHPSYQTAVHMNCICIAWKDRHYPAGLSQMNSIDLDSPLSLCDTGHPITTVMEIMYVVNKSL